MRYKDAGVDREAADESAGRIARLAAKTMRPGVLAGIGGFGGLFKVEGYRRPVLVAGADGVGTKVLLAIEANRLDTIGIDLVAMCANDVLTHGAEPLFFLDYLALPELEPERVETIVGGVARGCEIAGCALLGGETAQMPDLYRGGEFDLAGFCVGAVEEELALPRGVREGDAIIGLESDGLHSNGFSLVRRVREGLRCTAEELLTPTRIYVKPVLEILRRFPGRVHAMAHVTGGGLPGNLPRVIPEGLGVVLERGSWPVPAVIGDVVRAAALDEEEAYATFNMGVGFVLIVASDVATEIGAVFEEWGERPHRVGVIRRGAELELA
jgi:phosphoribosylformylglycinamidine cyclo-ligase